jgi:hypothetical protein
MTSVLQMRHCNDVMRRLRPRMLSNCAHITSRTSIHHNLYQTSNSPWACASMASLVINGLHCNYLPTQSDFTGHKHYRIYVKQALYADENFCEDFISKALDIFHKCLIKKCQVLTAASMKTVFRYVTPCSLVEIVRRFRGACCFYRGDDEGSKHLWNAGKFLPDYTARHPIRQPSSC